MIDLTEELRILKKHGAPDYEKTLAALQEKIRVERLVRVGLTAAQELRPERQIDEDFWRPHLTDLVEGTLALRGSDEDAKYGFLNIKVKTPNKTVSYREMAEMFGLRIWVASQK